MENKIKNIRHKRSMRFAKLILIYLLAFCMLPSTSNAQSSSSSKTSPGATIAAYAIIGGIIVGAVIVSKIVKKKKKEKADKIAAENALAGKKVKSIDISTILSDVVTLGSTFPIIIKATTDDGKELITEGAGKGKTRWDNYTVNVDGGTFSEGVLTVSDDYKKIKNHKVKFSAFVTSDPSQLKEFELTLNYKSDINFSYYGQSGQTGAKGQDGDNGKSGGSWTGSRGGDGQNGQNGGDGGQGGDGPDVTLYVKAMSDPILNKTLLYVKGGGRSFIIDPAVSKISISSSGGPGGSGGYGGKGGSGGNGGSGHSMSDAGGPTNGGDGGNGGYGGIGGNGGNGGRGGRVTVYMDPSAKPYGSKIIVYSSGGKGGFPSQGGGAGGYGSGGRRGTQGAGSQHTKKDGISGSSGKSGNQGSRYGNTGQSGSDPIIINQEVTID